MSPFNKRLEQAKMKQRSTYLAISLAIVFTGLFLLGVFFVANGTRIIVSPDDANDIARLQVTRGLGFSVGDTVYSLSRNTAVQVSASGFKPATEIIPERKIGKTHNIKLYELPGILRITTSSPHEHTRWINEGQILAIANRLDHEFQAGKHLLLIDDPYYELKQQAVTVKRAEITSLETELKPISRTVNILSKPSGAEVFIDGTKAGVTPLTVEKNGGQYSIRVSMDNYQDIIDELEIKRGFEDVKRNYLLELRKARLIVKTEPENGKLLLDGIMVDAEVPIEIDAVISHQLVYLKDGFFQQKQTFSLQSNEEKTIVIKLNPEQGIVELNSSPSAKVWVSGKEKGQTPLKLKLSAVPHRVTFRKEGYRSISKTVKPSSGSARKISVNLVPELQASLDEAKQQYTNLAGGKLKLFLPDDLMTLGAARHEKGQRANEFLRSVSLSRPFYAGLYEVTNGEFARYDAKKKTGVANEPVTSVSWSDAALFCNWLSKKEKLNPFYIVSGNNITGFNRHADGYRLLSEAEWEWLARKAGKRGITVYVWGDESVIPANAANIADEMANGQVKYYVPNYTDQYAQVAPVGSFAREKSGLFDMAGNVSEWVHDFYSITPPGKNDIQSNPLGDQSGATHVVKGASWRSGTVTELRPAFREGLVNGRDDIGFRIGRYLLGGKNE